MSDNLQRMKEAQYEWAMKENVRLNETRHKWEKRVESLLEAGNSLALRLQDFEPDNPAIQMWIRFASGEQKPIDNNHHNN